jgi:hypothetical protein
VGILPCILYTHIPNIAAFTYQDPRMEVAKDKFKEQLAGTVVTKLETSMSFLQIKASMGLHEKIRQVCHEICQNRRETALVRLEAIAGQTTHTASFRCSSGFM